MRILVTLSLAWALVLLPGPALACRNLLGFSPWWDWGRAERIVLVELERPDDAQGVSWNREADVKRSWKASGPYRVRFSADRLWSPDPDRETRFRHALLLAPSPQGSDPAILRDVVGMLIPEASLPAVIAAMDDVARIIARPARGDRAAGYFAEILEWSSSGDPVIEQMMLRQQGTPGTSPWGSILGAGAAPFIDRALAGGCGPFSELHAIVQAQVIEAPSGENVRQLVRYVEEAPACVSFHRLRRDRRIMGHAPIAAALAERARR